MSWSRWKMMAGVLSVSLGGLATVAGQCPKPDTSKAAKNPIELALATDVPAIPAPTLPEPAAKTPALPAPGPTVPPPPSASPMLPTAPAPALQVGDMTPFPTLPGGPVVPPPATIPAMKGPELPAQAALPGMPTPPAPVQEVHLPKPEVTPGTPALSPVMPPASAVVVPASAALPPPTPAVESTKPSAPTLKYPNNQEAYNQGPYYGGLNAPAPEAPKPTTPAQPVAAERVLPTSPKPAVEPQTAVPKSATLPPAVEPQTAVTKPAPALVAASSLSAAATKFRIVLRVGEGEPTFEVRSGDDLLMKVFCEKVDIKSPEKGSGPSVVKAMGKVRFTGFGAEGVCDELTFLAGTGEVNMVGHVTSNVKDRLGRVESELTTETMKYKIDPTATGSIKP